MLKLLLKKQFMEFFRAIFHDAKKNRRRSTAGIVGYVLLYVFLILMMAGLFAALAWLMCDTLVILKLDWFYFSTMTLIAITFGTFGSLFTSYSSLYLAKDNDLLLSMPIPSSVIVLSRLTGTYLLGLMYSAIITVPTSIVYFISAGITIPSLIGCIVNILVVSIIVLILSALLGWIVAQVSLRVRNKNIVLTVLQLVFLGAYIVVYSNMTQILQSFLEKAVLFGLFVKDSLYPLYLLGTISTGSFPAMIIFIAITAAAAIVVYQILNRSFLKTATATGKTERKKYRRRRLQKNSVFMALVNKEARRFLSSAAYMINCGLGTCGMIVAFIFLLIKRSDVVEIATELEQMFPGVMVVIASGVISAMACMNDSAAPSVSLEGKNLWITKSLPVTPLQILLSKAVLQILITAPFTLPLSITLSLILPLRPYDIIIVIGLPLIVSILFALFNLMMSILLPNLNWTNEIVPIKQSMAVVIALVANMVYTFGLAFGYLAIASSMDGAVYLAIISVVSIVLSAAVLLWIIRFGTRRFMNL